ncbi:MAG: FtsX-like permease family protein, partial [Planctomycetota bacterium]
AGWIEPRPTAITVAALAAGVVEELLVVEGQDVKQGQLIARLIATDAEIEVEQATATLQKSESERQEAEAELNAAQLQRDNPLYLRLPLAEARGVLAKAPTESDKLPYLIEAAETELSVRQRSYEAKMRAGDAVPGSPVRNAEGELASAQANRNELKARVPNLQREIEALQEKVDILEKQRALQIDDHGRVAKAEVQLRAKEALRDQSSLRLRQAELDLERMHVVAPIEGAFQANTLSDLVDLIGFVHWLGYACVGLVLTLVATTMVMSVQDRLKEYAVLQTIGIRPLRAMGMVLSESTILCFFGGLLGALLATVLLAVGGFAIGAEGATIAFKPSLGLLVSGVVVSSLLGLLAGLAPAIQAATVPLVKALQSEPC